MSISIEKAVEILRAEAIRQDRETGRSGVRTAVGENGWQVEKQVLPLKDCRGRELAEDLVARLDQPPFPRSTMDGYALTDEDRQRIAAAGERPGERQDGEEDPFVLQVVCTIDAGDTQDYRIGPGQAARIMTGARIPAGAALVVPQEETEPVVPQEETPRVLRSCGNEHGPTGTAVGVADSYVRILELPERENIASPGEDFRQGEVLAAAGTACDSYLLSCAAAAGYAELAVRPQRRAAVISTGDELVTAGSCRPEELRPGQIFDSNRVFVTERLRELGCEIVFSVTVPDEMADIAGAIRIAAKREADLIVTTGGVSVGEKDLLEEALRFCGGEVLFHGIRLKPGMPTMAGRLGNALILALSGNPYSASAVLELLYPYGVKTRVGAERAAAYPKARPVPRIARGTLAEGRVSLAANQKNGVTRSGIGTNALIVLPEGDEALPAGTRVMCFLI